MLRTFAVLPKWKAVANAVHRSKKKKVAGLKLERMDQLVKFTAPLLLPAPRGDGWLQLSTNPTSEAALALSRNRQYAVPLQAAAYKVEGAVFTGPTQIKWIEQLLAIPGA